MNRRYLKMFNLYNKKLCVEFIMVQSSTVVRTIEWRLRSITI